MNVFDSLEVRWFAEPDDSTMVEIAELFESVPVEDDKRADFYYIDGKRTDFSVKERTAGDAAPKLEFKNRVEDLGTLTLHGDIVGQVERWMKLALDGSKNQISSSSHAIEIKKTRRLRKFSLGASGSLKEVSIGERLDAGCGAEFTQIVARNVDKRTEVRTFGLEAFGPPPLRHESLARPIRPLLVESTHLRLIATHSMSYPLWLHRELGGARTHRLREDTASSWPTRSLASTCGRF